MSTYKILHPVYTLDRRIWLQPGTTISLELMDDLIASDTSDGLVPMPFLEFETIREDLLAGLRYGPFPVIFNDQRTIEDVLSVVGDVLLPVSILRYFSYFKSIGPYTYSHTLKVVGLTAVMARSLMGDRRDWVGLARAAAVHDLGKACVAVETLKKNDPLTRTERGIMEHHTLAGYVLLGYHMREMDGLPARVALAHHERRDGSGYPLGLSLACMDTEIVTVCDIYDALISPRPYREEAYDNRSALEEIVQMADRGILGWEVVKALIALNRKDKPYHKDCVISRKQRGSPPKKSRYGVTVDDDPQE